MTTCFFATFAFLSLRETLGARQGLIANKFLVITMGLADGSCHCLFYTCRMSLARSFCLCTIKCPRFLSLRAVQNARCGNLLVSDRHTTFAMTTLNLPHASCHCDGVKRQKQSAFKQHLFLDYFATLVMTKTKMAARQKASRHDNPTLTTPKLLPNIYNYCKTMTFSPLFSKLHVCLYSGLHF